MPNSDIGVMVPLRGHGASLNSFTVGCEADNGAVGEAVVGEDGKQERDWLPSSNFRIDPE